MSRPDHAVEKLHQARSTSDFSTLSMLEKNLAFNLSGHVLHSLFRECLSPEGTVPILAIDAWDHAYYLQYENDKRAFFEAVWAVIDWPRVAARLDAASLNATASR